MTRATLRRGQDRLLSIPELAELLGYAGKYRCKKALRLFRRLEARDDERYLVRTGARTFGVRLSSIERALPWSPGTLTGIRLDVDQVGAEVATIKKRVNAHGGRLQKLEAWRGHAQKFLSATAELLEDA